MAAVEPRETDRVGRLLRRRPPATALAWAATPTPLVAGLAAALPPIHAVPGPGPVLPYRRFYDPEQLLPRPRRSGRGCGSGRPRWPPTGP